MNAESGTVTNCRKGCIGSARVDLNQVGWDEPLSVLESKALIRAVYDMLGLDNQLNLCYRLPSLPLRNTGIIALVLTVRIPHHPQTLGVQPSLNPLPRFLSFSHDPGVL